MYQNTITVTMIKLSNSSARLQQIFLYFLFPKTHLHALSVVLVHISIHTLPLAHFCAHFFHVIDDETRVVLMTTPLLTSDYINASYINVSKIISFSTCKNKLAQAITKNNNLSMIVFKGVFSACVR